MPICGIAGCKSGADEVELALARQKAVSFSPVEYVACLAKAKEKAARRLPKSEKDCNLLFGRLVERESMLHGPMYTAFFKAQIDWYEAVAKHQAAKAKGDSAKDNPHCGCKCKKAWYDGVKRGYDVNMICAYAPHSGHATETKEEFYADLSEEIAGCHGRFYVGGDFNARIHSVREHDTAVCGPLILGRGMEYLNTMNEQTKESRALFLGWWKMHHLSILNSQFSKPAEK